MYIKKILLLLILFASLFALPTTHANDEKTPITVTINKMLAENNSEQLLLTAENYTWIWDEYQHAPGDIQTEDIVYWGSSFGPYHNYEEVTVKLQLLEECFPQYVDLFSIGKSVQNRELWAVRLTNESVTGNKTEYYLVAAHHAREAITVENALYFIDRLIYEATVNNVTVQNLLNTTEIYVIPLFNPDGHSILYWYPEQRKNMRISDDDNDGSLEDEFEVVYVWNDETNRSEIQYVDSDDPDTDIGEDAPGGVDLNRNYNFHWYGSGSSSDRRSDLYRGPSPDSEPEVQALEKFLFQHDFRYALSLHSGIFAIIMPWGYDLNAIPPHYGEFNAVMNELCTITGFPTWQEVGGYAVNGEWGDYNLAKRDTLAFTIETYTNNFADNTWDFFNPPANQVINNSKIVYNAAFYLASNPHLNETNNLPSISTPTVEVDETAKQVTISWSASDPDNDELSYSVYYGANHTWQLLDNDITTNSLTVDFDTLRDGTYTFKVVCYDGTDRVISYYPEYISVEQPTLAGLSATLNSDKTILEITVDDDDMNKETENIEYVSVNVTSKAYDGNLTVTLTETDISTGIFKGKIFLTTDQTEADQVTLLVNPSDTITVVYYDNETPDGPQLVVATIPFEYQTSTTQTTPTTPSTTPTTETPMQFVTISASVVVITMFIFKTRTRKSKKSI